MGSLHWPSNGIWHCKPQETWILRYPWMRYENVLLHGILSSIKTVTCSVPQGSRPYCFFYYALMIYNVSSQDQSWTILKTILVLYWQPKSRTIESIETNNELITNNDVKHWVEWLRGIKLSLNETETDLLGSPLKQLLRELVT